jgi:predicted nucleic acid-binding protein
MPGDRPRSYWDSCVFLAWINGEPGRAAVVDSLLRKARTGELEIVTSVLSVTEVAFTTSERQGVLSPPTLSAIEALWDPPSQVKLVEFHRLIAVDARQLIRQATAEGLSLKPPDAIHLCTARRSGSAELLTYDPGLNKFASTIGVPVREPVSDELPLEYGA